MSKNSSKDTRGSLLQMFPKVLWVFPIVERKTMIHPEKVEYPARKVVMALVLIIIIIG